MLKANLPSYLLDLKLLLWMGVRVHKHDSETCNDPFLPDGCKIRSDLGQVETTLDDIVPVVRAFDHRCLALLLLHFFFKRMLWSHAPALDFNHSLVNGCGCFDLEIEDLGSALVANRKGVG